MKNKLLFAFCIFCGISVLAQENFDGEIRWGNEIEMKKKEVGPIPIGLADGSLFSMKKVKKDTYLQTLNLKTLSIQNESELTFEYKEFDLTLNGSFVFGDRPIFITSYIDKAADERHYLIHELENNDLGKPIELAVVPYVKLSGMVTRKKREAAVDAGAFSFNRIVSEDYETLMISFQNGNGSTETVLYNKDLDEVSRNEMELPYENFMAVTGRLSNTGRYYMVGYEFEIEESKALLGSDKRIRGDYHMIVYDAVNGEVEDIPLAIDRDIYSISLKVMDDESAVAYGMYSNENATGVSGAFFQKFNPDHSVAFTTLEEFEEDFITQFWSDKQKKKAEKKKNSKNPNKQQAPSLYSYIMHDLVIKENGDMTLLAEQYYMYVTTTTHSGPNGTTYTTTTYHYLYNDIIAVNCDKNGDYSWKQKIKKRQHSINDGGYYSSFYTITQGNEIHLMYNDKEANMDDADEAENMMEKRKQKKNTIAALISLSEDGEASRKTLFDFEEDSSRRLVPKQCEKMSANEILLYTRGRDNSRILGWMTID